MSDLQACLLFQSGILTVTRFRCSGCDTLRDDEEATDEHEIVFVRSGAFVKAGSTGSTFADPCSALLYNKQQPFQVSHPIRGGDVCVSLAIRPDTLMDLLREIDETVVDRQDAPFERPSLPMATAHHLTLASAIAAIRRGGDPLEVEERLVRLAYDVYRVHPASRRRAHSINTDLVHRTQTALNTHFREKLTLDKLAALAYTSAFHLCRVFKSETGLPIHRCLERLRLVDALTRIADQAGGVRIPGEGLSEIALAAGFASHSHFTASFRRTFGLTPSQFRQSTSPARFRQLSKILTA